MTDQNTSADAASNPPAASDAPGPGDTTLTTDTGADAKGQDAAKGKPKKVTSGVVWVQPGHSSYTVGQFVPCDLKTADKLRAQGYARIASAAEVELYTKSES